MYRYFVSFAFTDIGYTFAFSNTTVTTDAKIASIKDVRDLEAKIMKECRKTGVSIISFYELDTDQNGTPAIEK